MLGKPWTIGLMIWLGLVGVTGCKTYPTYYADASKMATNTALKADQAYIAPNAAALMTSRTLLVHVADMPASFQPKISKWSKKTDYKRFRKEMEFKLADAMWQAHVFSDVSATSDLQKMKNPDLRLDVAVTGWDEGSGLLRFLLPGFVTPIFRAVGTGPTRLQMEGRMIDARTGAVVLEFAEARLHPGGPNLALFSLRPFRSSLLIAEDVLGTFDDLKKSVHDIAGVSHPMRKSIDTHSRYRRLSDPPSKR